MISVRAITPAATFSRIVARSCDLLRCTRATALFDLERPGHVHAVATPFSGSPYGVLPREWTCRRTERVDVVLKSVGAAGEDGRITVILHHSGSYSERTGRPDTL